MGVSKETAMFIDGFLLVAGTIFCLFAISIVFSTLGSLNDYLDNIEKKYPSVDWWWTPKKK
jgi:hypothetical protein